MKIEIFGDGLDRSAIPAVTRHVSARGIVVKDGRILGLWRPKLDVYTLPGGGKEAAESLSACVEREVLEETGAIVQVGKETCVVIEYFRDSIWESHFFPCEATGRTGSSQLTAEESALGLEASWYDLYEFLQLLETHESTNPCGANIHQRELIGLMNTL